MKNHTYMVISGTPSGSVLAESMQANEGECRANLAGTECIVKTPEHDTFSQGNIDLPEVVAGPFDQTQMRQHIQDNLPEWEDNS